jgi:pyruvate dehydrogenase phosphatase
MMVARSFGNGRLKWERALVEEINEKFNGPQPLSQERYRTPPYLTSEPVISTTRLTPGQAAFMILATDGL